MNKFFSPCFLFFSLCFLFSNAGKAQLPASEDSLYLCYYSMLETDSNLFVDIQVAGFTKVVALQWSIYWDNTSLQVEDVLNMHPDFPGTPGHTQLSDDLEELVFSWWDPLVEGMNLFDGETILTIKFKKLKDSWTILGIGNTAASRLNGSPGGPPTYVVPVVVDSSACIFGQKELLTVLAPLDQNGNCQQDAVEPLLSGWPIVIISGQDTLHAFTTASAGNYQIPLPFGEYTVQTRLRNELFSLCDTSVMVNLSEGQMDTAVLTVGLEVECPLMRVTATTPFLRRCFANKIRLTYCNEGSVPANNAQLQVQLDEFMIPLDTTLPWSGPDGKQLVLDVGTVPPGTCGDFVLDVEISCDAELGQTHCLSAKVFPDTICLPAGPSWTGSNIEVRAEESGDTLITFHIENTGSGDMLNPLNYTLVENDQLLNEGSFQLTAGESMPVAVECTGAMYRLIAAQEADHPYAPASPTVAVEGCGSMPVLGFMTQFPEDRSDPSFFRMCQENIGSYDPNDKQAIPRGVGTEHFIAPGTQLEYLIRFQNTGTDTAFRVEIRDTLSTSLDLTTLQPMCSSHPYRWEQKGQELVFIFDDILLPDSATDLSGSQGYVQFRAEARAEAPLGTVINNSAAIYFDFNEPIITNTVFHTLGLNFLTVATYEAEHATMPLKMYPNPAVEYAVLELPADWQDANDPLQLEIFDWTGRILRREVVRGRLHQVQRNGLPAGSYGFALRNNAKVVSRGILVWQ